MDNLTFHLLAKCTAQQNKNDNFTTTIIVIRQVLQYTSESDLQLLKTLVKRSKRQEII